MNLTPHVITPEEWQEIFALPEVREQWGLEDEDSTPEDLANDAYGVRFDFFNATPGYVGDLFILQGDCLGAPPLMLVRRDNDTPRTNHAQKKPLQIEHFCCEHAPPAMQ